MAQNNSVFVWKTSSYSSERPKLRNDLNQVTNLKSLGFTWKRIANLLWVFPEVCLCDIDFCGFFDVAFDLHISSITYFVVDGVAKLVFVTVSVVLEADYLPAPTLLSSLLSPLFLRPLVLGNSLSKSFWTDGCWLSPSALFPCFWNQ